MAIHEAGDEFFRPTNQAWKCSKCGATLLTVSCIISHMKRCTNNPDVKAPKIPKTPLEIERDEQVQQMKTDREERLNQSLREFKRSQGIK